MEDSEAGTVRVVGWVAVSAPTQVTLTSGARTETVPAEIERLDVALGVGASAYGFETTLAGELAKRLCLWFDGVEVACRELQCRTVFGAAFRAELEQEFPGQRAVAHVVDTRTGCEYGLRPDTAVTTASVIKIQVLAEVLRTAELDDRDLTEEEQDLAIAMMRYSLNPETGALIGLIGGVAGLERSDQRFGAEETTHVPAFGATVSTARDRTAVALRTLHGGGPLDGAGIERAWGIMQRVHPAQSWGISAGLPATYDVALKNGFFPLRNNGWRMGSSGFVSDPDGGGYAVTIMTDFNVTQRDGLELVETVARHVNERLTVGEPGPRPFDEVRCVVHTGGQSWATLTARLDLPADRVDDVRRVAGGDGPMEGQLVCEP